MPPTEKAPTVVLVRPQLAENIGATARAMINFGATELRLVNPSPYDALHAARMACDGRVILETMQVYPTLREALADCTHTIATSRRIRRVKIAPLLPKEAVARALTLPLSAKIAFVFGAERAGLTNDEIFSCDTASTIPASKRGSLNLGQSVLIYLYEWFLATRDTRLPADRPELDQFATHEDKQRVYDLMHTLLIAGDYKPRGRLPEFMRRIKYLFEARPLTMREQKILLKAMRYFEKLIPKK